MSIRSHNPATGETTREFEAMTDEAIALMSKPALICLGIDLLPNFL